MKNKFEAGWAIPESRDTENEFVSFMKMSREEIDSLLLDTDVGVLSLAKEDEVYSIPMSYGYNPEENLICLMIGYAPQSKKRKWIERAASSSFVVHEMKENGESRSVVVEGKLREVEKEQEECAYKALENASFTALHETGAAIEDSDFSIYKFEIGNIEGRKFEHDAAVEVREY